MAMRQTVEVCHTPGLKAHQFRTCRRIPTYLIMTYIFISDALLELFITQSWDRHCYNPLLLAYATPSQSNTP
jgi:hypothetical protein